MTHASPAAPAALKVAGLDAIRFVCAMWVLLSHAGRPALFAADPTDSLVQLLVHVLYGNAFSGTAAVIVFFVISGFCIHLPYANAAQVPLSSYLIRRYVRIALPLAVAVALSRLAELQYSLYAESILWSLYAELIYYTLYPALRQAWQRLGWTRAIGGAFIAALAVLLTDPGAEIYPAHGVALTWLLGLPLWMLGCHLAQLQASGMLAGVRVDAAQVWAWRLGIWGLSVLASVARFHSPIGHPWTLTLFGVAVYFWLRLEIAWFTHRPAPRLLEGAGAWSYSLYLVHKPILQVLVAVPLLSTATWPGVALTLVLSLAGAFAFYLLVERPSHEMARWASRRSR